ncbi:hypothetical protein TrRE_jg1136, partial [Triparma retinervis]
EVVSDHPDNFDPDSLAVTAQLKGCKGLPSHGFAGVSPYVKFALTNEPDKKRTSSVKSRTCDPVWAPSELFEFYPLTSSDISTSRLIVSVFHRELIGKDYLIGDGIVKLSGLVRGGGSGEEEKEEEEEAFSPHRVPLVDKAGDQIDSCYVNIDLKVGCAFT